MILSLSSRPAPWRERGNRLRDMRVKRGVSLREMAKALGSHIVAVGEWERGVAEPPLEARWVLALDSLRGGQ